MRLKLDENLGRRGITRLREAGHDVATVREQDLGGAADITLIEVCRVEDRGLVTLDLDFSNPVQFPPSRFAGLAVLRWTPSLGPSGLDACLDTLLQALAQTSLVGKLWIVEPGRIREYAQES